jgi:hypothetical protein
LGTVALLLLDKAEGSTGGNKIQLPQLRVIFLLHERYQPIQAADLNLGRFRNFGVTFSHFR